MTPADAPICMLTGTVAPATPASGPASRVAMSLAVAITHPPPNPIRTRAGRAVVGYPPSPSHSTSTATPAATNPETSGNGTRTRIDSRIAAVLGRNANPVSAGLNPSVSCRWKVRS